VKGTVLVVIVLTGMLLAAAGVAWWSWHQLEGVEISTNGMIALFLGITMTISLGVGLMWLVYYSNKRGYDDHVGMD
jgi:hypothetical protein